MNVLSQQIYFGVCVTICVTASWVGATHCIKYLYLRQPITNTGYSHNNNTKHHHIVSCDSLHKNMKQKLKSLYLSWTQTLIILAFSPPSYILSLLRLALKYNGYEETSDKIAQFNAFLAQNLRRTWNLCLPTCMIHLHISLI